MFLVHFQRLQHVLRSKKHVIRLNKPSCLSFSIISNDTIPKEALSFFEKIHQNPEMLKHYTTIDKKLQQTRRYNNTEERLVRTVNFLNRIGFSHVDALFVVARMPQIMEYLPETMMKRVKWMKRIELTKDAILTTITRHPRILIGTMDKGYEALSEWFIKQGVCPTKIHTLIMKNPHILSYRIEENLEPTVEFLKSCGLNQVQIVSILQQAPNVLGLSIKRLQQTVDFLLSKGCTKDKLPKIFSTAPNILGLSIERLQQTVDFFFSKGCTKEQLNKLLFRAPTVLHYTKDRLQGTLDFLLSKGYSQEQVFRIINQTPTTFNLSLTNMEEKLDLLTEFFGKDAVVSILDRCPHLILRNAKEMRRVYRFLKEELEWDVERIESDVSILRRNMDTFLLPRYQFLLELEQTDRNNSNSSPMKKTFDQLLEKKEWTYLSEAKFHQLYPSYEDFLVTYENKYLQY